MGADMHTRPRSSERSFNVDCKTAKVIARVRCKMEVAKRVGSVAVDVQL